MPQAVDISDLIKLDEGELDQKPYSKIYDSDSAVPVTVMGRVFPGFIIGRRFEPSDGDDGGAFMRVSFAIEKGDLLFRFRLTEPRREDAIDVEISCIRHEDKWDGDPAKREFISSPWSAGTFLDVLRAYDDLPLVPYIHLRLTTPEAVHHFAENWLFAAAAD
jgi:hypothetical protein